MVRILRSWAYANFDEYDTDLFRAIAGIADQRINSGMSPQVLLALRWSCFK